MNATYSEIRKLTTLPLTWAALAVGTLLSALIGAVGIHTFGTSADVSLAEVARAPVEAVWFVVVVVGVLVSASEFRHGTVVTTLLATPRRSRVLATKAAVAGIFGALFTAVGSLTAVVSARITGFVDGIPVGIGSAGDWGLVAGAVLVGGIWGVVASGLGLLTRSTAVALTAVLLWKFALEGIAPVVLRWPELSAWTPSGAADALVAPETTALSPMVGALMLTGYAVTLCAVAAATFVRVDPR